MTVEIWSDIQCPFCYIGKRKFEGALARFEGRDDVEIIWKSFQLNPDLKAAPGKDVYTYLAEIKGMSREQSVQMHKQVSAMAEDAGLKYDFDRAVIANSFNAHRLIQFAKTKGLGDAAEERLFKAYFMEGEDVGNTETLAGIGVELGLDADEVNAVLSTNKYAEAVAQDILEAQQIGVRGVPFFVIDRKYAVSGAQPSDVFLNALTQAKSEALTVVADGASCDIDGNCD